MGLPEIHTAIDALESEHKSLVRWIAEATALVNDLAMRDAVPPLDKDQLAAKRAASALLSGLGAAPKAASGYKRRRPTAPKGVARTFGLQDSNTVAIVDEPPTKYAKLRDYTPTATGNDGADEERTQAILTEIRVLDELLEDCLRPPAATHNTPTDGSCCAAEVTTTTPTEAELFLAWELGQDYIGVCAVGAAPAPAAASGKRRQRLLSKTSPALAVELGYSDDECTEEASTTPTVHGGYILRTAQFIWCVRCGASAQEGNVSKYLRAECNGKPPNASMRQRRSRLIRGVNPNNSKPLNARATRVNITHSDS